MPKHRLTLVQILQIRLQEVESVKMAKRAVKKTPKKLVKKTKLNKKEG